MAIGVCAMSAGAPWASGQRVEAKYLAQTLGSARCKWYAGRIASPPDADGRCGEEDEEEEDEQLLSQAPEQGSVPMLEVKVMRRGGGTTLYPSQTLSGVDPGADGPAPFESWDEDNPGIFSISAVVAKCMDDINKLSIDHYPKLSNMILGRLCSACALLRPQEAKAPRVSLQVRSP